MTTDDARPAPSVNLELKSLRPRFVEAEHGLYVSLLVTDITGSEPSQNIAVSGAYGSGKSSVLAGLLVELEARSIDAIQVTLATLNQSREALLEVSGEATLTSALEKEVVKRLLYSAKPTQIPRSRFNRIGGFRPWASAGVATVTGVLVTGVAETFGVSLPMDQLAAAQDWWGWTAPALDLLSVGALTFAGQAALAPFKLSQIAVGPATLSLDDKDGNYFDHFLDEIIYFFQRTKIRVVLFEDLDRFNDPGIFLALRELNNLLNSSQQVKQQVTFVYAIRDSLFVQAIESADGLKDDSTLPDAHARYGADSAASDRAKFFDLIVPVVPFISHEVAADLLLTALRDVPNRLMPSRALVVLAGRHFTDMRVILSIRNEFEVFAAELLEKSAVRGLTPDQLFAMVVYKHIHLDDFERIRTGESKLDDAIDRIRTAVVDMVSASDAAIAEVEDVIDSGAGIDRRAQSAGERLLAQLDVGLRFRGWGPVQTVTVDGTKAFPRAEVASREFWLALAGSDQPVLRLQSAHGGHEVAAEDVATLLGADRNPKAWTRSQLQRDRQRLAALKEARAWLVSATFAELLAGPFPAASLGEGQAWTRVGEVCGDALGFGLPFQLIRAGYLDQNFALYTTKFHGAILSADARSYLMQYADRHRSEPLFALTGEDVDEIVARRGDALLNDPSALNVAIVDRLLETQPTRLPLLLETTGQATEFLVTYLASGQSGDALLRRVASKRSDILDVVSSTSGLSEAERRKALSVCLSALSSDLDYSVSATTSEALSTGWEQMDVLRSGVDPKVAVAISDLLASNELRLGDLSIVAEPLRTTVASVGAFVICRTNLEALTDRTGEIGLDTLGGLDDGVGRHLIADMPEYLSAVREDPTASIVDDPRNLDEVVRAIVDNDPSDLGAALGLLREGVIYDDLAIAPETAYADLARAGAFAATRANLTQYLEAVGAIDAALAARLEAIRVIEISQGAPDAEEESARHKLATQIVASDQLDTAAKIPLVESLKTTTTLEVGDLRLVDPDLAARLLAAGVIADDLGTFNALALGPWPVFEACAARSSAFGSFACDLTFTPELLAGTLASGSVSDVVKRALLGRFDVLESVIGSESAVAWMATATALRVSLTAKQLTFLGQAGARSEQLIDYLAGVQAGLTATDLVAVLGHCDKPYSDLAKANGATVTLPFSDGFRTVLQALKSGGVVKDFHKRRMRDQFEVHMVG